MTRIDFIAYPPTSFPFRDLLVLEQLPLSPADTVCEIGVGSGETTARMAKLCRSVVGFDISESTVKALRYLEGRQPNLSFMPCDITDKRRTREFAGAFSRAVACDTLEHVHDPRAFFEGVAALLSPGGRFLVTFPNEPERKMHGVTRFSTKEELLLLVTEAGLTDCTIATARLSDGANKVAERLGWGPLRLLRRVLRRGKHTRSGAAKGGGAPQTFDQTDFARKMPMWRKISPAIDLYWYAILKLMVRTGPSFIVDPDFLREPFTDCQVVITGKKP